MGLISTEESSSSADAESDSPSPVVTPQSSSLSSDTEPEPEVVPPKPSCGWPRKPKTKIVKEKTNKIRWGQCTTWRHCSLCRKKFPSQAELNHHTVKDHKYTFLCSRQPYKKAFTSKSALDKHSLHHKNPDLCVQFVQRNFITSIKWTATLMCTILIKFFHVHTHQCNHVYKSQGEYNRHRKSHCGEYVEFECSECGKKFSEKKNRDQHMELHSDDLKEVCTICGKAFHWKSSPRIHRQVKHPSTPPSPPSPEY